MNISLSMEMYFYINVQCTYYTHICSILCERDGKCVIMSPSRCNDGNTLFKKHVMHIKVDEWLSHGDKTPHIKAAVIIVVNNLASCHMVVSK